VCFLQQSAPRSGSLQQRWRTAMEQQAPAGPAATATPLASSAVAAAGLHMQQIAQQQQQQQLSFFSQYQQQQQQQNLSASWQQNAAPVGLLGQSVSSAAPDSGTMLQWQQIQQYYEQQQQQHQPAAAAAAAALASKAAAAASSGPAFGSSSGALQNSPGVAAAGATADLVQQDSLGGLPQPRGMRNSSSGTLGQQHGTTSMRVSSADDVMFMMEESAGPSGSATPSMQQDGTDHSAAAGVGAASATAAALQTAQHYQQMAVRQQQQHLGNADLIASSPLELAPIDEQQQQQQQQRSLLGVGSSLAHVQPQPQAALMQPSLQAPVLQQQQQHEDDDLELQEEEVMDDEHPGDWNPLYSDEQLLGEQASPVPAPAPAAVLGAALQQHQQQLQQPHGVLYSGPLHTALPGAGASPQEAAAALGMLQNASRSRRGSMVHVRAMSVELPGGVSTEDEIEAELVAAGVGAGRMPDGSLPSRPVNVMAAAAAAAAGGMGASPTAADMELGVGLDPHWSFRQPTVLMHNPLHNLQQQQQQQ
jgi:hypothetical protein